MLQLMFNCGLTLTGLEQPDPGLHLQLMKHLKYTI